MRGENVRENVWVSRAKRQTLSDIGQLSREDIKDLEKAVRQGAIIKGKGGCYGNIKTCYAPVGTNLKKERRECIEEMIRLDRIFSKKGAYGRELSRGKK